VILTGYVGLRPIRNKKLSHTHDAFVEEIMTNTHDVVVIFYQILRYATRKRKSTQELN